jgi:signal transduction histidine kinase
VTKEVKKQDQVFEENAQLKRTIEELSILSEFATSVAGMTDLKKILNTIVLRSLSVFRAGQGVITLVGENKTDPSQTLIRIAITTSQKKVFHFNEGLLGWMLLHKKPLLLNDPRNHPQFKRVRWDEPITSLLCAPMMVKGNLTGVLTIYNSEDRLFSTDDQRLLSIIAIQMAQVVENVRLDEEKRELQLTIARDLHDDVASSLSSIALYAETLKNQLGDVPPDVLRTIEKMSSLSQEAVDSMGDIVWSIAPQHDSLQELLFRLKNLAIDLCNAKYMRYHFKIPEVHIEKELPGDVRRSIYLIYKEALNNVIKHSSAKNVTIDIHVQEGAFIMQIKDDGIGFSNNTGHNNGIIEGGHGLNNMRKRASEIEADLRIESNVGKGTTVEFIKK